MPLIIYAAMAIYLLANYYIYRRVSPVFRRRPARLVLALLIIFLFSCYWLAEVGRHFFPPGLIPGLRWIGSWWIGFLFYAALVLLLVDLIRLMGRVFHFLPSNILHPPPAARGFGLAIVGIGVFSLLMIGHCNARKLRLTTMELELSHSCGHMRRINMVLVSDIHLGIMTGDSFLSAIIKKVNNLNPDIIILGGDTVDMNTREIEKLGYGKQFAKLQAPLGVYAVTGNHEYITGVDQAVEFLLNHGIRLLRDQAVKINGSFYLVGREDMFIQKRFGTGKTLPAILRDVDPGCPVILIDHQPGRINEAVDAGVDLLLCGHTHDGQLFPLNLVTDALYEISSGYGRIGGTQIYVTSGAGTWAPPVRIGNVPEIVQLKLEFCSKHRPGL